MKGNKKELHTQIQNKDIYINCENIGHKTQDFWSDVLSVEQKCFKCQKLRHTKNTTKED